MVESLLNKLYKSLLVSIVMFVAQIQCKFLWKGLLAVLLQYENFDGSDDDVCISVSQGGADSLGSDRLGCFNLSIKGHA